MLVRTRKFTRGAIAAALSIAAAGLLAPAAEAGSYVVSACGAAPGGVNHSWAPAANHANVTAYTNPCAPISGGLIARAAANGSSVPVNAAANWTFLQPNSQTVITGLELSAEIYRFGGDSFNTWGAGLTDNTGAYLWGNVSNGYLHVGTNSGAFVPIEVNSRTALELGVACANGAGCTTASSGDATQNYSRARTALYGARVTLSNWTAPVLAGGRGVVWTANGWVKGTQDTGFDAGDDVGVQRMAVAVDDVEQASDSVCDFTYTVPCPVNRSFDASFNTAGFADGAHKLWFRATDSAGNVGTDSRWIFIDNTAPAAPATPALSGAPSAQWRTTNGFTLTYSNPSTEGGSLNIASDVEICPIDEQGVPKASSCTTVSHGAAAGSNTFNVPAPGKYRARVRVHDNLHTGAWSDWGPVLRFDDVVPGAANPQIFNGWVSKDELAAGLRIEAVSRDPRPASGLAGYAVSSDGSMPGSTASLPSTPLGAATLDISEWPDGVYTVKARAVSIAGLHAADADVRATTVRIDTTAPQLIVAGAPDQGATTNRTTTFELNASDALSGVAASPSDSPVTSGGYIAYSIDGAPESRVRGGSFRLTAADGRHTIRFSAIDVAGNRSPEQAFTFTQDTSPPQGGLLPTDPQDQRNIAFFVAEGCIAAATIELRTDGSNEWRSLATEIGEQVVTARVPDDVWAERTPYTVRAQVTDCAGNSSRLDQWYGGTSDGRPVGLLTPPLRAGVRLTIAFSRLELTKRCVTVSKPRVVRGRNGRTRIVRRRVKVCPRASSSVAREAAAKKVVSRTRDVFGVLTDGTGRPLVGREVQVQTQLKAVGAPWQTVRAARTDSSGMIRAQVRKFTSLRVRLIAPRDEVYDVGTSGTLTTNVSARSTIRASARSLKNGQVLRLTGRVLGGHIPAAGMHIALYGFSPTKEQWLPVRTTVTVDPRGAWVALYRFTATRTRATYRFRVRVPEGVSFPFSTGYSRSVTVRVRP